MIKLVKENVNTQKNYTYTGWGTCGLVAKCVKTISGLLAESNVSLSQPLNTTASHSTVVFTEAKAFTLASLNFEASEALRSVGAFDINMLGKVT